MIQGGKVGRREGGREGQDVPVSSMPGILIAAPERTEKSKGLLGFPNSFPVCFSMILIAAIYSSTRPKGRSGS